MEKKSSPAARAKMPALYWQATPWTETDKTHKCICGCGAKISDRSKAVMAMPACRQRLRRQRLEHQKEIPKMPLPPVRFRKPQKSTPKAGKGRSS